MYWKLFLLWVCLFGSLRADDDIDNDLKSIASPLFVGIGSHCEIAVKLRENNLRKVAFPFDWMLTLNHDRFLQIFKDDFKDFLNPEYYIQHPVYPSVVEHFYYQVEFRHDWPFPDTATNPERYLKQIQEINSKYTRRIGRFKQIKNYEGKVIFIRIAYDFDNDPNPYWGQKDCSKVTFEQALSLKSTLEEYFPTVDFTLVIVNYTDEYQPKIEGIEGVCEFKIRKTHKHEDYRAMFQKLNKGIHK